MSAIARLQHFAIRLARQYALRVREPETIRLFHPSCRLGRSHALPGMYGGIFVSGEYSPPVAMPARPRIVDLGTFIGLASIWFLEEFPDCRLTCVEANPYTFRVLEKNMASYLGGRDRDVTLLNKAVADRPGTATLTVNAAQPVNVATHLGARPDMGWRVEEVDVPLVDFHEMLAEPIDFLKMDIEGAEYPLLAMDDFNPDSVRAMSLEIHDIPDHKSEIRAFCDRVAQADGYRISTITGRPVSVD